MPRWQPIQENKETIEIFSKHHKHVASERLKVPGGWVVRTIANRDSVAIDQIFVSDPNHEWQD
ncbi:hypothetical protein [Geoalkalibacter halelectricus]|uniref:hypothetical protein n=1 Tax=Geoalkalibacter halelectricus TaxID=2847045 RepID=UPI003D1A5BDB